MSQRRRLGLLLAAVLVAATAAGVAVATNQPGDEEGGLRQQLATTPLTVRAVTGPVMLRETFTGQVRQTAGQRLVFTGEGEPLVSSVLVREGQHLGEGSVIGTVEGSPVVVLSGSLPSYRALRKGMTGPDVAQLHDAMRVLGLPCYCGTELLRSEIRAVRRFVFERAVAALDQDSWHDEIPQSGIVWLRRPSVVLGEITWRVGRPATQSIGRTHVRRRFVMVPRVPSDSRVAAGQVAITRDGGRTAWRSHVARVASERDGTRSVTLKGRAPARLRGEVEVEVRTVTRPGKALLVPAAAVGRSSDGHDRILVLRGGRSTAKVVRIVAELGGRLAVRGAGLHAVEDVVVGTDSDR